MTKLTQSQIVQIRTAINWIEAEASISNHNAKLLGYKREDEEVIRSELCTALDNIATAAQEAKRILQGVKARRPIVCLDKRIKELEKEQEQ